MFLPRITLKPRSANDSPPFQGGVPEGRGGFFASGVSPTHAATPSPLRGTPPWQHWFGHIFSPWLSGASGKLFREELSGQFEHFVKVLFLHQVVDRKQSLKACQ